MSEWFRAEHADVPWHHIVGMRHKIAQDYMDIDFDIVWDVATVEMPRLLATLSRVVGDTREPGSH